MSTANRINSIQMLRAFAAGLVVFGYLFGLPRFVIGGLPAAAILLGVIYLEKHGSINIHKVCIALGNS